MRLRRVGLIVVTAFPLGCTAILGLDRDYQEIPPGATVAADGAIVLPQSDAAEQPYGLDASVPSDTGADPVDAAVDDAQIADAARDARTRHDAAGDASDAAVAVADVPCGEAGACTGVEPVCCYTNDTTAACQSGATCAAGLAIVCHVASDCPGATPACCASLSGTNVTQVSCQDFSACTVGATSTLLCDPAADAGACPNGTSCKVTNLANVPATYYSCQP